MEVALEIAKWVGIVFAAGVVGQLGKSLTLKILAARRRRREQAAQPSSPSESASSAAPETVLDKGELKVRKKELKAEAKLRKKRGHSKHGAPDEGQD